MGPMGHGTWSPPSPPVLPRRSMRSLEPAMTGHVVIDTPTVFTACAPGSENGGAWWSHGAIHQVKQQRSSHHMDRTAQHPLVSSHRHAETSDKVHFQSLQPIPSPIFTQLRQSCFGGPLRCHRNCGPLSWTTFEAMLAWHAMKTTQAGSIGSCVFRRRGGTINKTTWAL